MARKYASVINPLSQQWLRWSFFILMFIVTLTGFAQMPIFKRYYIADIPGLGWLNQFYVTHLLHYLGAVFLLGVFAYAAVTFILVERKTKTLTTSGHMRIGLLFGLVITGGLMVLRNYVWNPYPPKWIVFLDLAHLSLALLWILAGAFWLLTQKRWVASRKKV